MDLTEKKCVPCEGGIDPLNETQIKMFKQLLHTAWKTQGLKKIFREFSFVNFAQTMVFTNKVADLSEEEGHHPDMHVSYGKCVIELWTHAINGLSENDFILASKIDKLRI